MVKLNKIVSFLDDYLKIADFKDPSYNGLQFEGKQEVNKVLFAVDAGIETFETAIAEDADMIIVHHGHFWKGGSPNITGFSKKRFKILMENEISLYAVHLPLDAHPEVGNNSQILSLLKSRSKREYGEYNGQKIGFIGKLDSPMLVDDISQQLERELSTKCITLKFGKDEIKDVAVCSGGGGASMVYQAIDEGVDLFITGEPTEVFHLAKDAELNVIFAGHHATETLGVKALSETISKEFSIETMFIDIPTGI